MYEYKNYEFFIVDQFNTPVVDLVELGVAAKYDGGKDNMAAIVAICDFLNLKFRDFSYKVPQQWVKVPNLNKVATQAYKPVVLTEEEREEVASKQDTASFLAAAGLPDLAAQLKAEVAAMRGANFMPIAIGENQFYDEIKIPAYRMPKGDGMFYVVAHNFKTNKTYVVDVTGTRKRQIELFVPCIPRGRDNLATSFVAEQFKKLPLDAWVTLSKKISSLCNDVKDSLQGAELFGGVNHGTEFARANMCRMLYAFFTNKAMTQRLGTTHPVQLVARLIKDKPPIGKLLHKLAEDCSHKYLQDLVRMYDEQAPAIRQHIQDAVAAATKAKDKVKGEVETFAALSDRSKDREIEARLEAERKERLSIAAATLVANEKKREKQIRKRMGVATVTPEQKELARKAILADKKVAASAKKK